MTKTLLLIITFFISAAYAGSIERTLILNLLKGESVEEVKRIVGQPDKTSIYTAKIVLPTEDGKEWVREWLDYSKVEGNKPGYGPVAYFVNGVLVEVKDDMEQVYAKVEERL